MMQRLSAGAAVVLLAAGSVTVVLAVRPSRAAALTRSGVLSAAASYGPERGYHVGIAVYDTQRNRIYGAGASTGTFASESVVKAMIANRLLVQGRMYGTTARRAYKMITQSDDGIASSFYGSVGGDGLIHWIKQRYKVWDLGYRPSNPGWWGNTHITPRGLVKYYARMKRDPLVGPWLLNAMHHATRYGSDGTYQYFGIPSATSGFGIKQGWGCDYGGGCNDADFNTTGFVNNNRYAVAILARGPVGTYGNAISSMLTETAKLLLPGGRFPEVRPEVRSLSTISGRVAGGERIGVRGAGFTQVRAVLFGQVRGSAIRVIGPGRLRVTTPQHAAGNYPVRVVTTHGTSLIGTVRFRFVRPPAVTAITPSAGRVTGATTVSITGARFDSTTRVLFGGVAGSNLHVTSETTLTVVAPEHAPGTVDVRVVTRYGSSPLVAADRYTYVAPPSVTGVSPQDGPATGGTVVTITGANLDLATAVLFGSTRVAELTVTSPTTLTAVAPAHAPGQVDVTVRSPGGTSPTSPADAFTFTG
jgi:hypothetical protein